MLSLNSRINQNNMNFEIEYSNLNTGFNQEKFESTLNQIASIVSQKFKVEFQNQIQLTFLTAKQITELNKEFRQKDKPTDVLSWGYIGDTLLPHELAGDIYICLEVAKKQAKEKGHSLDYELIFLFTHGLLHVFGYDHQNDEDEAEMNKIQKSILDELDI